MNLYASRHCSWCRAVNPFTRTYCRHCGHCAHKVPARCDCPQCSAQPQRKEVTPQDTQQLMFPFMAHPDNFYEYDFYERGSKHHG
jgi:hypothetical protein